MLERRGDDVKRVQRAPPAALVHARRPLRTRGRDPEGARAVRAGAAAGLRRSPTSPSASPRSADAVSPASAAPTYVVTGVPYAATHFLRRFPRRCIEQSQPGAEVDVDEVAIVRGVCSSPAEVRVLPSGEHARPAPGHDAPRRRGRGVGARRRVGSAGVGCRARRRATRSSSLGRVRRRFFRAGAVTRRGSRSRPQVVARSPRRRRVQALRAPRDRRARRVAASRRAAVPILPVRAHFALGAYHAA